MKCCCWRQNLHFYSSFARLFFVCVFPEMDKIVVRTDIHTHTLDEAYKKKER